MVPFELSKCDLIFDFIITILMKAKELGEMSLKDIDQVARTSFPLCMRHLFDTVSDLMIELFYVACSSVTVNLLFISLASLFSREPGRRASQYVIQIFLMFCISLTKLVR